MSCLPLAPCGYEPTGFWPCCDRSQGCSSSEVPPSGRVSFLKQAVSRLCSFKTVWSVFTGWERRNGFNARTPTSPHCGERPAVTPPKLASLSRSLFSFWNTQETHGGTWPPVTLAIFYLLPRPLTAPPGPPSGPRLPSPHRPPAPFVTATHCRGC